jgi:hypothetical protein
MRPPILLRAARRLAAIRPEARRFAVRAWLAAPVIRGSLALVGLRSTLRWVESLPAKQANDGSLVGVDEGRTLVQGAFRAHVVGGACLERSLVQYLLHRRDGLPVRLVLGVKPPTEGELDAHAWVEAHASPPPAEGRDFVPLLVSESLGP